MSDPVYLYGDQEKHLPHVTVDRKPYGWWSLCGRLVRPPFPSPQEWPLCVVCAKAEGVDGG